MPRQKSIVTVIRDLVRSEIRKALSGLFGGLGVSASAKPQRRRRRRRRKAAQAGAKRRGRPRGRKRKVGAQSPT
jgi:hypothetical protein